MVKFGFIVHEVHDDARKVKRRLLGYLDSQITKYPDKEDLKKKRRLLAMLPPWLVKAKMSSLVKLEKLKLGIATGIQSPAGSETEGIFWGAPYTPSQMIKYQPISDVIAAAKYCQSWGAEIIGLGAYTSIIGDGGFQIANTLDAGITTGNSLTAVAGVNGLLSAAKIMGHHPEDCKAAVIGAGGSVGKTAAKLLAKHVRQILLVGRTWRDMLILQTEIGIEHGNIKAQRSDLQEALETADLIITVTSATEALDINPTWFRPGAVVCDIARPRDIGRMVAVNRPDVFVFEGGILKVPGEHADLGWDFGFPPKTTYACMAETIVLSLEGITSDYSLGKNLDFEKVLEIERLANKHGFELAGFRSFDEELTEQQIDEIRGRAREKRKVMVR